jgi:hypothetical protein
MTDTSSSLMQLEQWNDDNDDDAIMVWLRALQSVKLSVRPDWMLQYSKVQNLLYLIPYGATVREYVQLCGESVQLQRGLASSLSLHSLPFPSLWLALLCFTGPSQFRHSELYVLSGSLRPVPPAYCISGH